MWPSSANTARATPAVALTEAAIAFARSAIPVVDGDGDAA